MPETKPKLVAFLGRPVRYISIVPGHASATAFICGFGGTEEDRRVDLLVMDEKKKNLLNTMNWPMAFSRVHDVPHLDAPPEQRTKHCFDFMYAEEGDDFDPWKKKKVVQMPKAPPAGESSGVLGASAGTLGTGEGAPSVADLDKVAEDEKAKAATAGGAPATTTS